MEWTGPLSRISEHEGKRGRYSILTVGGQEFFCFKELPACQPGDVLKVTYDERPRADGKGKMFIARAVEFVQTPATEQIAKLKKSSELEIKLQVLHEVSSIFFGKGPEVPVDVVLTMSEELLRWLKSDEAEGEPDPTEEEVPF